jgi:hypothetical protein
MLSRAGIVGLRRGTGTVTALIGLFALVSHRLEAPLAWALVLLGGFILGHFYLDEGFQKLKTTPAPEQPGLQAFATGLVSTAGLILGLMSAFSSRGFTLTAKVGVFSLAIDVLLGIALVGLLLAGHRPNDRGPVALVAILFNVVLWGLAFGLLCIALALIFQ